MLLRVGRSVTAQFGAGATAMHTYTTPGTYTATLTVTDARAA